MLAAARENAQLDRIILIGKRIMARLWLLVLELDCKVLGQRSPRGAVEARQVDDRFIEHAYQDAAVEIVVRERVGRL